MNQTDFATRTPVVDARVDAITRRLRMATPLVLDVVVTLSADGVVATMWFDPALVRARASQQGLADSSIAAAAANPRVRALLQEAMVGLDDVACRVATPGGAKPF